MLCRWGPSLVTRRVFMISKYQQLTLQGEGWQAREWRQNGGIVVYEETATAHFVSTAVCRTETLSVDDLHLCSPVQRNKSLNNFSFT